MNEFFDGVYSYFYKTNAAAAQGQWLSLQQPTARRAIVYLTSSLPVGLVDSSVLLYNILCCCGKWLEWGACIFMCICRLRQRNRYNKKWNCFKLKASAFYDQTFFFFIALIYLGINCVSGQKTWYSVFANVDGTIYKEVHDLNTINWI